MLEHRYGLSAVPLRVWIGDHLKGLGLSLALVLGAAEFVYFALARWPRVWWAASALAGALVVVLLARLTPAVLLPMFYRFKPLDRDILTSRIESLSRRAGMPVLGVYEWGLGDKTRRANAALVGTGQSRRILLSDTLLAHYTDDEIEVILAHELGHHAHRDIRNGLVFESLLIALACGAAAVALHVLWKPLDFAGPTDVAGLPVMLLAAGGRVPPHHAGIERVVPPQRASRRSICAETDRASGRVCLGHAPAGDSEPGRGASVGDDALVVPHAPTNRAAHPGRSELPQLERLDSGSTCPPVEKRTQGPAKAGHTTGDQRVLTIF